MIGAAISGLMTGGGMANMILGSYPPLGIQWNKSAFRYWPNMIPGVADLIALYHRERITSTEYFDRMREQGYDETTAQNFLAASYSLLTPENYVTLLHRDILSEDNVNKNLSLLGYSAEQANLLKKIAEFYPSVGDLITFAVREVFTTETAAKYGQFQDIPEDFIKESHKVGLSDENARRYWAAHWNLPSITQGFEMFHRDIIDEDGIKELLKSLDVMPYWREKLMQMSYSPLTRVDVRRMYGTGTLSKDEVYDNYRYFGYSPDNAQKMTDFTIKYENGDSLQLNRSAIVKAYKLGIISDDKLLDYLNELYDSPEIARFYYDIARTEKQNDELEAKKKSITDRFLKGDTTIDKARTELTEAGYPAPYIDNTVEELKNSKGVKVKLPSKTDLENWLKLGVIDEDYYTNTMLDTGYRQQDIEYFLTEIALEKDTSERRFLSQSVYVRWLKKGIITEEVFTDNLTKMKVSQKDIDRLIEEVNIILGEKEGE